MKRTPMFYRFRPLFIIFVTLIGVIINSVYGAGLLYEFFDPQTNDAFREVIISAIALEFGWAALLLWALWSPIERRHVLLFTAIPMVIGNLLHNILEMLKSDSSGAAVTLNSLVGLAFAGLFILAYFSANSTESGSLSSMNTRRENKPIEIRSL
jgi:glucose uptake protein GlcU